MPERPGHLGVGDRLREPAAAELTASAFALEAADGGLLWRGLSLADLAHITMLVEREIVPQAAGSRLLAALLRLHALGGDELAFEGAHGDAYTNRERRLHQEAPDEAGWLKAGRARREASTIAYLLATRSDSWTCWRRRAG